MHNLSSSIELLRKVIKDYQYLSSWPNICICMTCLLILFESLKDESFEAVTKFYAGEYDHFIDINLNIVV